MEMSTSFGGGYALRSRIVHGELIDLTRLSQNSSPGPSTSHESPCVSGAPALYTQLQDLEEQDGVIRNAEFLFCTICDSFVDIYDGILIRNCLHQICIECIRKYIMECAVIDVKCPVADCQYPIQDREIRSLLTVDEYKVHVSKNVAAAKCEHLYEELLDLEQQGLIYNTEPFECKICFTDVDVGHGILIRECLHQYCKDCIRSTINLTEEIQIKCPTVDCDCYVHDREIHALLTPEEYDKYSMKTLRIAESQAANSYHCKKANCEGWCFVDDEVNFFHCPRCSSENCLPCQVKCSFDCNKFFVFWNCIVSIYYRQFTLDAIAKNIKMSFDMLA